jgi:RNAse (barnase) inhibitor barstar
MKSKKNNDTIWSTLTNEQKVNIEISLQQLSEGKGIPIKRAMAQLTKKYDLPAKAK